MPSTTRPTTMAHYPTSPMPQAPSMLSSMPPQIRSRPPTRRSCSTKVSRAISAPSTTMSVSCTTAGCTFSNPRAACASGKKYGSCCDQRPWAYTRTTKSTRPSSSSPSPPSSMPSTLIPHPRANSIASRSSPKTKTFASAPQMRTRCLNGSARSKAY